ncbi:hypothetical protein C4K18_5807 [Pseudomonas chlororaphis subsp. aurantiaca]|nr:hypothetical protein C4K18_5807 [Pseudomonas chlororaphis subsp. aurantiaca]
MTETTQPDLPGGKSGCDMDRLTVRGVAPGQTPKIRAP